MNISSNIYFFIFIIYFNNKLNWAISYFFFFENNLYLLFIINQCNNSTLCYFNEVIIPSSGVSSDNLIFSHCNVLTDYDIFYSVTSNGGFAFSECVELKEVEIPSSVKSIEQKNSIFS